MSQLKQANLNKCYSYLKEFIADSGVENGKKGFAVMALEQLHKITAGDGKITAKSSDPKCIITPRAG